MKKLIAFSLLVFLFSVLTLHSSLMEQWTIEDRYWEPDGTNLMQDRLDVLDTLGGFAILGCLAAILLPIIGYFGFFKGKAK